MSLTAKRGKHLDNNINIKLKFDKSKQKYKRLFLQFVEYCPKI